MTSQSDFEFIEDNLIFVLDEMSAQPEVGQHYPANVMSYEDEIAQIREFIELAGEYGLAFEYINSALEQFPYRISGKAAVKLLEVGLLMGFKSENDKDKRFDRRH
ncbi:hypothetical protein [Paraburkholderia lycopersici]|uniref:Uncharacterized protein n=1 Tax=Paraburkholderia lycopersici TaxID=416944 RepID=A0A1G6MWD9_9BURK|nr:hypothetical protein [Paraburkholderia lycopersici]SDC59853.1 hypothetical protein SAMN05421548_108117 [Paraburkholderia lycopersici]